MFGGVCRCVVLCVRRNAYASPFRKKSNGIAMQNVMLFGMEERVCYSSVAFETQRVHSLNIRHTVHTILHHMPHNLIFTHSQFVQLQSHAFRSIRFVPFMQAKEDPSKWSRRWLNYWNEYIILLSSSLHINIILLCFCIVIDSVVDILAHLCLFVVRLCKSLLSHRKRKTSAYTRLIRKHTHTHPLSRSAPNQRVLPSAPSVPE